MELHNADCMEVFKTISDESVDCVVTDCPYHIVSGGCCGEFERGCGGMFRRDEISDTDDVPTLLKTGKLFENNDIKFNEWLPEIYRVLKEGTHCYIMINPRNLKELWEEAEKVGFKFQQIIVWDKGNATPNMYYMNAYENILMLRKGKAKYINDRGTTNILRVANVRSKFHPTEKSVDLMKILIENSTNEGDVVLDPFMGSGSTGVACRELSRDFIGIEIDQKYYDIAKERIEKRMASRNEIEGQTNIFDLLGGE